MATGNRTEVKISCQVSRGSPTATARKATTSGLSSWKVLAGLLHLGGADVMVMHSPTPGGGDVRSCLGDQAALFRDSTACLNLRRPLEKVGVNKACPIPP